MWTVLLLGAVIARGESLTVGQTDPVETLPTFTVVDSRLLPRPESWRYAQIPGFEILANTSDHATKRFVRDFQLLQEVVQTVMPGLVQNKNGAPTTMILCGRGDTFETFLRPDQASEAQRMNSLFLQNTEHVAIVVDFALGDLELGGDETEASDPYRAFYLEYFRSLIRRTVGRVPPPWFEEGMGQLMASMDFDAKHITFGEINSESSGVFTRMLARHALLPMNELFATERPATETNYWSAQAYEFVHFCLYGNGRRFQPAFIEFALRSFEEPVTEALFKECFKMSYKDMLIELRGYTTFTAHQYIEYNAKKGSRLPEPAPVVPRAATDAEVGRIKGEALRLCGLPDAAHLALIAPYVRGERDPQLLAALGLDELEARHDERAAKFLEAATAGKVVRPRAYLAVARFRHARALAKPAGPDGKFSPEQTADVLGPLMIAQAQPPPMSAVYDLMAEVWMHSSTPPSGADLAMLYAGVNRFRHETELIYRTAFLSAELGHPTGALALVDLGLESARDEAARTRLFELRSSLAAGPAHSPAPSLPTPK